MTVGELIYRLKKFDPDSEVVIGMVQRYGTNFAMEVSDVSYENVEIWDNEDAPCVVITEGSQIGSVSYEDNDNDEEDWW